MYNKSEIMRRAWEIVREADLSRFGLRATLRRALIVAWRDAKEAVALADHDKLMANPIRQKIWMIECKNRLTDTDYARIRDLQSQLAA